MKLCRLLFLSVVFVTTQQLTASQMALPVNIQSPNAASLGNYGYISVDNCSGVPNVSIPLTELKAGDLSADVTLSYDASGIRINSHPSWVGQNWTLNVGGVITRSARGYEDEYPRITETFGAQSPYQSFEKAGFFTTYGGENYINFNLSHTNNKYDCEPDIFSFNFLGKSGRFFMGNDGQWKVQSDHNIQILFYNDQSLHNGYRYMDNGPSFSKHAKHRSTTINGFRIRDDEGYVYVFGFDENAIEYSIDFFNQISDGNLDYYPAHWVSNAWYLSEVFDRFGNKLFSFQYKRGKFIADFYNYYDQLCFQLHTNSNDVGYCEPDGNINDGNIRLGGNLISPVYIEKVESIPNDQYLLFQSSNSKERPYINMPYYSNNGDNNSYTPSVGLSFPINTITDFQYRINAGADFDDHVYPYLQTAGPDTQYVDTEFYGNRFINPILCLRWLKLDAIHLVSNNTPIVDHIKSVRFNYNQNNSNDNQRLLPMSLNFEYANPGFLSTPQPSDCSYTFQYYGNISDVKKYLNTNVNGWGFDYGNTDGILKSIKYPTGGKSVFAYNTNYASNVNPKIQYDGSAGSGGGLKVTSIKDFRGGNNDEFVEKKSLLSGEKFQNTHY
jgi:hypothetical protein